MSHQWRWRGPDEIGGERFHYYQRGTIDGKWWATFLLIESILDRVYVVRRASNTAVEIFTDLDDAKRYIEVLTRMEFADR